MATRDTVKVQGIDLWDMDEELTKVEPILDNITSQINEAWGAANQPSTMFTKKRDDLIKKCNEYREEFRAEVSKIREKRDLMVGCISSANDSFGKGVETVLEGQTLPVHDLASSANRDDLEKAKEIARRVACLTFTPCRLDAEHILGELSLNQWRLEKEKELALTGRTAHSLASTRDGRMVVVCYGNGVEVCSVNGSQGRRLQDVWVKCVSVLRDGRYVVGDWVGYISLYSQTWEKINATVFEVFDHYGDMDVDGCDHIYVGCEDAEAVRVFTPEGGAPVREIPCPGYKPLTVCTMNHSEMLVLSDCSSVRVVDEEGKVMYDVNNEGFRTRVAVLQDDTILIGWVKPDVVSIDLYTNQLRLVRRVLANYRVNGYAHAIREFSTGEVALFDHAKVHIFCRRHEYLSLV